MAESPYLLIAEDILQEIPGRTAHVDDIARRAIEANKNIGLGYEILKVKVNAALNSAVKRKSGSVFTRVLAKNGKPNKGPFRKGYYRLKRESGSDIIQPQPAIADRAFLGKGGEYAVASELMFWGFNVSFMAIDKGVDLVVEKASKYHNIQVKTSNDFGGFWQFTIQYNSFTNSHSGQTYYVMVLRQLHGNVFFVIPSFQIDNFVKTGVIKSSKSISFKISKSESGKTWYLNTAEITHQQNAFQIIS